MDTKRFCVILLAAGQGARFGAHEPKQWTALGGRAVVDHTLASFAPFADAIEALALVVNADELGSARLDGLLARHARLPVRVVVGGRSREQSTANALAALEDLGDMQRVLVHDAARPLVPARVVRDVLDGLDAPDPHLGAVVPVLAVTDTIKDAASGGTLARSDLRRAQTPQGFTLGVLRRAHGAGLTGTDDASLTEQMGLTTRLVAGSERLHKLTTAHDRAVLEAMVGADVGAGPTAWQTRVGFGFDVHAFMAPGNAPLGNGDVAHRKQLVLGGVTIPIQVAGARPLAGHSDADVVLHAATDAVLGALADGDIGQHFPPTDPQWRGASSDQFLAFAVAQRLGARRGGRLVHLDITIICEAPKIGPLRQDMAARIAHICGDLPVDAVSIKASTTERLGFTGRSEGIACQVVATVELPRAQEPGDAA